MSSLNVLYEAAQARMTETHSILLTHRAISVSPHANVPIQSKKRKRQQSGSPTPSRHQPSRRRTQQPVSYAEIDSDDEMIYQSDEEYDCPAAARKKAKALPKSKTFPFLSLPRELRDTIYQHCLVDTLGGTYIDEHLVHYRRTAVRIAAGPDSFMSDWGNRCDNGAMPRWPHPEDHQQETHDDPDAPAFSPHSQALVPALLGVCKQMRAEAAPMLYAQPLYFADGRALHGFLASLTPATRGLLRDITLLEDHRGRSLKKNFDVAAFTLLAEGGAGTNLVRLRLADMMEQWLDWNGGQGPKAGARRFYRRAFRWLEAMRVKRGIDETVAMVQVIDRDYEVWKVGEPGLDYREVFWAELRRLIAATERNW